MLTRLLLFFIPDGEECSSACALGPPQAVDVDGQLRCEPDCTSVTKVAIGTVSNSD